jgi:hypothetical protein
MCTRRPVISAWRPTAASVASLTPLGADRAELHLDQWAFELGGDLFDLGQVPGHLSGAPTGGVPGPPLDVTRGVGNGVDDGGPDAAAHDRLGRCNHVGPGVIGLPVGTDHAGANPGGHHEVAALADERLLVRGRVTAERADPLLEGRVGDAGGHGAGAPPMVVGVDEQRDQDENGAPGVVRGAETCQTLDGAAGHDEVGPPAHGPTLVVLAADDPVQGPSPVLTGPACYVGGRGGHQTVNLGSRRYLSPAAMRNFCV